MFSKAINKTRNYLALEKSLRALIIIVVLTRLSNNLWVPLLGLYVTGELGVSLIMYGLMNTTNQLVLSLAIFPSGFFSDNFGRKNMIILSIIFSILALITLFFVKNIPWLFLVSIFQGLNLAFIGPSQSAYVIDVIQDKRRGIAFATIAFFRSLSTTIAVFIAGAIATIINFYGVFGAALAFQLISLIVTIFYLKESLRRDTFETKPSKESLFRQLRDGLTILKSPPLLAVLFGIVFHQLGIGIQNPYITIYADNILMFSLPTISLMLGLERLGIFIGHLPGGRIVDKYGGEVSFAFHILATSPLMILFTVTKNPSFAGLILFSWGLTFGLDNVSRQKLIPKYRSKSKIATAFGVISLIAGVTSLVSPTIGGWVWTNYTPQTVFYASAIANVLGSIPLFALWLYNRIKKRQ